MAGLSRRILLGFGLTFSLAAVGCEPDTFVASRESKETFEMKSKKTESIESGKAKIQREAEAAANQTQIAANLKSTAEVLAALAKQVESIEVRVLEHDKEIEKVFLRLDQLEKMLADLKKKNFVEQPTETKPSDASISTPAATSSIMYVSDFTSPVATAAQPQQVLSVRHCAGTMNIQPRQGLIFRVGQKIANR